MHDENDKFIIVVAIATLLSLLWSPLTFLCFIGILISAHFLFKEEYAHHHIVRKVFFAGVFAWIASFILSWLYHIVFIFFISRAIQPIYAEKAAEVEARAAKKKAEEEEKLRQQKKWLAFLEKDVISIIPDGGITQDSCIEQAPPELPTLNGELHNLFREKKAISSHVIALQFYAERIEKALKKATDDFSKDRDILLKNQMLLKHKAEKIRAQLDAISGIPTPDKAEINAAVAQLVIPDMPQTTFEAIHVLSRPTLSSAGAHDMSKALIQGDIRVAAVLGAFKAAEHVIKTKKNVSEASRELVSSQGQIKAYQKQAKTVLSLLDRSHKQLVETSKKIHQCHADIKESEPMMAKIAANSPYFHTLQPNEQQLVNRVFFLTLSAKQSASESV
jgi:peptidoglycan hydrolase CwlO-like protein